MNGGFHLAEKSRHADPLEASWNQLHLRSPKSLAADSGAKLLPDGNVLRLKVVDREYDIDLSAREIGCVDGTRADVSVHLQILILHYLAEAGKALVANRLATFRDFEGGDLYYSVFKSRAIDPIVQAFGNAPEVLQHIGKVLGAEPVKTGNVGFRVHFFPELPIVVVLWLGDEEVPPSANILFDANAGKILPTEDLAVAAEALVHSLIEISRR